MRILLAEDDSAIQKIAGLALERVGKHEVLYANNGLEALSIAEAQKPDVILLDIMMPELDGFQCCQALKSNAITKNIPVIFLTARAQSQEIQKGIGLGALGCIVKPFDPMKLSNQIAQLVGDAAKDVRKNAA